MAEGGGEEENPFSFKKFVSKTDKKENDNNDNSNDDFEVDSLPDISLSSQIKEKAPVVKEEQSTKPKKKGGDENPFSFKRFLESSSNTNGARPKSVGNRSSTSPPVPRRAVDGSPSLSRNTPDFASDLPDFVQDHFSDLERERLGSRDVELPDFALNQFSNSNDGMGDVVPPSHQLGGGSMSRTSSHGRVTPQGDGGMDNINDLVQDRSSQIPTSLPDFLSDGVFNSSDSIHNSGELTYHPSSCNNHGVSSVREGVASLEINGDFELELRRYREENNLLRQQLAEARQEAVLETQRCHKMKKDMEILQKKEAEDTAALERIVQQVEANLITTTQRAVKAENTVTRLQTEVKTLQGRLTNMRTENEVLTSGDRGLAEIRQRTTHVSKQLSTAASGAEQNIRQLLQGVESLRQFSQILSSVEKITEEPVEQPEPSSQPQQSKPSHSQSDKSESNKPEKKKSGQSQHRKSKPTEEEDNQQKDSVKHEKDRDQDVT
ncbi:serologically defined colon cancer antigen 3 homolog [Mizuhopecten yessoensis]|uniref:Endosome-associated-trafficking regulator 1 n=1 Tax=Mizuhopecten yessoensis TaxID=6573 RepID=A0A210PF18_MIZYE|nr:serologically defined colon cancer antigen 3 homolog [Mizuhopecten yessoensis]OWF35084.1 Serologically defined colon cancer antigen 3-like [Mizuhopecten yessoensis]